MRKGIVQFLMVCLSFVFFLGPASEAGAIGLLDDTLEITGFLKIETGWRLKDHVWYDTLQMQQWGILQENAKQKSGNLSRCRTTAQLEAQWDITSNLRLNSIFRAFYEAKYSLNDSTYDDPDLVYSRWDFGNAHSLPNGEKLREDFDIREMYLIHQTGDFTIRAGKQQIVWGESDNIRIADIINPLDYSWLFTYPDWEDIRIGQRMIDVVWVAPGSPHEFQIEVVLNPEDYKPSTWAPYGENWYIRGDNSWDPAFPQLASALQALPDATLIAMGLNPESVANINVTQSPGDAEKDAEKEARPEKHDLNNFSGGIRLRGVFGNFDCYLFNYYMRVHDAAFTTNPDTSYEVLGIYGLDPADNTFGIKAHYPFIYTLGGSVNFYEDYTQSVYRIELGYIFDEPFTSFVPEWGTPGTEVVKIDTLQYMIGFDRPTWIPFLNRTKTFFVSAQFIHKLYFDYDEDDDIKLITVSGKKGYEDHSTMITVNIDTEYWDGQIKPQFVGVWDINGHGGILWPKLGWEPTYEIRLELGAKYLWSDSDATGLSKFGSQETNDELYFMIEYKF